MLTSESTFENNVIDFQVLISSHLLKIMGWDVLYHENMISIIGAQTVEINTRCNFFMHLHKFLFFFIAFPSSIRKKFKYIGLCLVYLSFIQIIRIASFAIFIKYFHNHWDTYHDYSSYIFYYPGVSILWYVFTESANESIQDIESFIYKYFVRALLFLAFYHLLINPIQENINKKIIKPFIENNLNSEKKYEVYINKTHTILYFKEDRNHLLQFSIPFGQFYFFLLFILNFKPYNLIKVISMYNLALVPFYALAIFFFFHGNFLWGKIITINEQIFRLAYFLILSIKILNPKRLYSIKVLK